MANDFLTDLGASLNIFNQGVQQFATQRAISAANDQVQSIRDSGLAEDEKQQQFRNLAQDMTMRFMSAGAPAAQIQQFQETFAPKPPQIQTAEQGVLVGNEVQRTRGQKLIDDEREAKRQLELDKQDRMMALTGAKDAAKINKESRATLGKFQADYNRLTKDIMKSKQQADVAMKSLSSGNPVAPAAVKTMLARASGEVGNLTETERAAFAGRQDLVSAAKRMLTLKTESDFTEADKKALIELSQIYSSSSEDFADQYSEQLTQQLRSNPLFAGEDHNELRSKVAGKKFSPPTTPAQAPATPNTIQPNVAPSTQVGPSKYFIKNPQ